MSELTPIEPDAEEQWEADSWSIREATLEDVPAIAIAVRELPDRAGRRPHAARRPGSAAQGP